MAGKKDKLVVMASRGGTANEREMARRKLADLEKGNSLAVRSEEADDEWREMGVLVRTRKGVNAHLKQAAVRHFLSHVKDGSVVTNRTIPLHEENFGTADFYLMLSWLQMHDLCVKNGTKYTILSKSGIVKAWNAHVDKMRL